MCQQSLRGVRRPFAVGCALGVLTAALVGCSATSETAGGTAGPEAAAATSTVSPLEAAIRAAWTEPGTVVPYGTAALVPATVGTYEALQLSIDQAPRQLRAEDFTGYPVGHALRGTDIYAVDFTATNDLGANQSYTQLAALGLLSHDTVVGTRLSLPGGIPLCQQADAPVTFRFAGASYSGCQIITVPHGTEITGVAFLGDVAGIADMPDYHTNPVRFAEVTVPTTSDGATTVANPAAEMEAQAAVTTTVTTTTAQ